MSNQPVLFGIAIFSGWDSRCARAWFSDVIYGPLIVLGRRFKNCLNTCERSRRVHLLSCASCSKDVGKRRLRCFFVCCMLIESHLGGVGKIVMLRDCSMVRVWSRKSIASTVWKASNFVKLVWHILKQQHLGIAIDWIISAMSNFYCDASLFSRCVGCATTQLEATWIAELVNQ